MRFKQPTAKNEREWKKWVLERPACIREAVAKYKLDPWTLYRMPSGHRVYLLSLSDPDATKNQQVRCRVGVSGEFNVVTFERDVFGVDPAELVECDLPKPDEQVGSLDLPIDVVKNLHEKYKDADPPESVIIDLIARYPLRHTKRKS